MEILYLGHSSFRIRARSLSNWVTIITDPYDEKMVGLKFPKIALSADIFTTSHNHSDHNAVHVMNVSDNKPKILSGPGEYEIQGIMIKGIATYHDKTSGTERGGNTVFVFDVEGIRIAHLGDLGHKLTEDQLSEIGGVHVLLIPVGGFYTIDPATAIEVINQLEPTIVVPMHYHVEGMSSAFDNLAGLGEFEKALGMEVKRQEKLEIKGVPQAEEMQVVALEVKR